MLHVPNAESGQCPLQCHGEVPARALRRGDTNFVVIPCAEADQPLQCPGETWHGPIINFKADARICFVRVTSYLQVTTF
jgi:hypothetical protein